MNQIAQYEVKLPVDYVSYLINGDSSGIEDSEIAEINNYMEQYYDEANDIKGHVIIDVSDEGYYFDGNPAFGLACNVVDAKIIIMTPK